MIIVVFVIINNVSTSDIFARDLVPILDSRKSLDDYICQVALEDFSSLVYSNNGIKAAQYGGGYRVLQMLSLLIFHTTNVLEGDTRRELDLTISDAEVF